MGALGFPALGPSSHWWTVVRSPHRQGGRLWLLSDCESAENGSGDGWVDVQREGDEIWVSEPYREGKAREAAVVAAPGGEVVA